MIDPYEIDHRPHSFFSLVCDEYGEMEVDGYARIVGGEEVCMICQERLAGARE